MRLSNKFVLIFLMMLFFPGCDFSRTTDNFVESFEDLIENQESFEGKVIKVEGFLRRDYKVEDMSLVGYTLYSDASSVDVNSRIGIVFKEGIDETVLRDYVGSKVVVSGYVVSRKPIPPLLTNSEIIGFLESGEDS
ncbi:hypothetical protein [Marinimicrobium alkaliphilum]|uniref:hypothetical protein n=1 Tax=Marinimicrobium alkaliphilum TaxID=2202654 RepID=UPI000DB9AA88|nr:hypothetical protein [Marinimicrobium alkaliphilum]